MVMQTRDELDESEAGGPLAEPPPQVSPSEASAFAAEMFGVEGRASRLESERDANFRIEGDDAYVLKVYNSAEAEAVVEMQAQGMLHVAAVDPALPVPRLVTTREGKLYGSVLHEGRSHAVHLVTLLEGVHAEPVEFDVDALR